MLLFGLLRRTSSAMGKVRQKELKDIDISMMQAAVLFILKISEPPVTPAAISRRLFREPQTVFVLLNQMERMGLVKRTKDLTRRNMVRVTLTDKGEEAQQLALQKWQVMDEIMGCLSQEEYVALEASLTKLLRECLKKLGMRSPRNKAKSTKWGIEKAL
jgi:DNA-binding MarR family transcriptional regulator